MTWIKSTWSHPDTGLQYAAWEHTKLGIKVIRCHPGSKLPWDFQGVGFRTAKKAQEWAEWQTRMDENAKRILKKA